MSWIEIFILAAVQGITEFLPISSSAHLIIAGRFLDILDQSLFSDIAMHLGTVLAVFAFYSRPIFGMLKNLFGKKESDHFAQPKLIWLILLALIPTGIGGYFLKDFVQVEPRSLLWIGWNSILFGGLLLWVDRAKGNRNIDEMKGWEAILVGVFQVLALFPGVSRAGITITALRFFGLSRESSIYFSVLLSVPTILGASLDSLLNPPAFEWFTLLWSIGLSFIFTWIALIYFVKWVKKMETFAPFVWYRIVLGLILLLL